jgi:glycosyltransferase involved in cell wall biosynthesis
MPKVSVIIPTYNRAHYICAAVESVLAQTYRNYELIVVDDGSTDNTATLLEPYRDRLTYLQQPHSGLPAVGRNTGWRVASGEYVAFLDSDDLFMPERLASHVALLDSQPNLALVYSDAEYFTDAGTCVGTRLQGVPPLQGRLFAALLIDCFFAICSVTLRRSCLSRMGGFDQDPALIEDYDLWLRMAAEYEFGFVPGIVSRVRFHDQNISGGTKLPQYLGVLAVLARIAQLHPCLVQPHSQALRERRALLRLAAWRAYLRLHAWPDAARQFVLGIQEKPNLRWLAYLVTTPRPAQRWLARRLAQCQGVGG